MSGGGEQVGTTDSDDPAPRARPGRAIANAVAIVAIALAMIVARVLWSSRVELREADARAAAGEVAESVDHYGRAARLYAPGNPFSSRAMARLGEIARAAEAAGDRPAALTAWREVRSAILATRAVYSPYVVELPLANERIAALSAALESPSLDPDTDEPGRARWHLDRLARSDAPSVAWSIAAILGLLLWVGSAAGLLLRGLDEHDRLRGRVALAWAAGIVIGFALFLIGLARA